MHRFATRHWCGTISAVAGAGVMACASTGCQMRSVPPIASPAVSSESTHQATSKTRSVAGWASEALDHAGEPGYQLEVVKAVQGREREYFDEVLARVAKESRDVGAVLRHAARGLSARSGLPGAAVVVRELWARECCMRRGFLSEGLLGVVDGLVDQKAVRVQDAATALRLAELADHQDPLVAAAARKVLPYFSVDPIPLP